MNAFLLHCSFILRVFFSMLITWVLHFSQNQAHSPFSTTVSVCKVESLWFVLLSLYILINAWFVLSLQPKQIYLFAQRTKQLCMWKGLWETQPHCWPRVCSLHVVVCKIQKYIASSAVWSLANLNHLVVGSTCHWLFDYNTVYFEGKKHDAIDFPCIYLTYFPLFWSAALGLVLIE